MSEEPLSPEEVILQMTSEELCELLEDMGLEASPQIAHGIRRLIVELGSVDAAIVALSDQQQTRDAA